MAVLELADKSDTWVQLDDSARWIPPGHVQHIAHDSTHFPSLRRETRLEMQRNVTFVQLLSGTGNWHATCNMQRARRCFAGRVRPGTDVSAWNEPMQAIVKTLSNLGERTGIMTLLRRTLATSHALILALHRVLPDDENSLCYNSHLVLSESVFKSMLEWLQHDYQVVPLRDLLARPAGTNGHPKVAITFDDGWEDNYRVAFPHLVSFGMPATIFGCTGLIDSDQLLPEERFARLWARCASDSMLEPLLVDLCHWGMGNRKNQHFSPRLQDWSNELKQMPLSSRLLLLDHLESRYQIPRVHTRRFLTWEQVHIMTRTGLITMESHTSRHAALSSENDRDIRQELSDSRAAIWKYTGTTPEILAYPNGMHNRHVQSIVHSMGFRAALTTCPGFVTLQSNPMAIPRIAVDNTTVSDANVRLSRNQASMYFLSSWLRSAAAF